jgi:hypothetical protein
MTKLKIFSIAAGIAIATGFTACAPMTYFTTDVRKVAEADSIQLTQIQFYVDRDVQLRREVASGDAKVSSGVIKFENGKYVHIITLKKNTPGVCSVVHKNALEINFEVGDGKKLTFGVDAQANPSEVYRILANEWIKEENGKMGRIKYDGETYYIQPGGEEARLEIKKSVIDKSKVDQNTMKGVKVKS